MENNNKKEYIEKNKALQAIDNGFEMGYMQGYQDAKKDAMVEQAAMAQEMMGAAGGINPGSMPRPSVPAPDMSASMNSASAEVPMPEAGQLTDTTDKLINDLHASDSSPKEVKKAIDEIKTLAKTIKEKLDIREIQFRNDNLKKSMNSLGSAKKAIVFQQNETVENLMTRWETESKEAVKKLVQISNQHRDIASEG